MRIGHSSNLLTRIHACRLGVSEMASTRQNNIFATLANSQVHAPTHRTMHNINCLRFLSDGQRSNPSHSTHQISPILYVGVCYAQTKQAATPCNNYFSRASNRLHLH